MSSCFYKKLRRKRNNKFYMSNIPVIPMNDWILIEQANEMPKTSLVVPKEAEDQYKKAFGTIVAMGSEVKLDLKNGDVVYFNSFAGERAEAEGHEYLFIKPCDVLAKSTLQDV